MKVRVCGTRSYLHSATFADFVTRSLILLRNYKKLFYLACNLLTDNFY
jgi:hypothetical protein